MNKYFIEIIIVVMLMKNKDLFLCKLFYLLRYVFLYVIMF